MPRTSGQERLAKSHQSKNRFIPSPARAAPEREGREPAHRLVNGLWGIPNILSARVSEKLSIAVKASMQPANVKLVAANGKGIVTHGRVTIPIHLEEAILLVPVIVADIGETAGILGMKFLREADCSIAFSKGILRCGDREWQLTPGGVGEQVQRVRVDLPEHLATLADNAGGQLSIR